MKTIGAKELRLHLDQVLDRVLSGEDIIVSHRFKDPVRLSILRNHSSANKPRKLSGLRAFDAASKRASPFADKPIKDLYNESIARKYTS